MKASRPLETLDKRLFYLKWVKSKFPKHETQKQLEREFLQDADRLRTNTRRRIAHLRKLNNRKKP